MVEFHVSNLNFAITFLILMILIKKIGGNASQILLDLLIMKECSILMSLIYLIGMSHLQKCQSPPVKFPIFPLMGHRKRIQIISSHIPFSVGSA